MRGRSLRRVVLASVLLMGLAPGLPARVLMTQEEALALVFPGAEVDRRTAYLDEAQLAAAAVLAGADVPVGRGLVPHYLARRDGVLLGVAYFDTHRVRTEVETVMVAVDAGGRLLRIEVIAFLEPPDYMPRQAWLAQFPGHALDEELALGRAIQPMTGASLTAREITRAARRVLALHRVIDPLAAATEP